MEIEAEATRGRVSPGHACRRPCSEYTANALRDQIDQLLLVQKGKDLNINVDAEVTRAPGRDPGAAARSPTPTSSSEFIREQTGMTYEDYQATDEEPDADAARDRPGSGAATSPSPKPEMQKYYDEHKAEFVRKEQVFLSQILISTEGKTPEQVAAAEKKAKDLVARARKGEKFSDLARDNSDDAETAKNGGQIGPIERGMHGQGDRRHRVQGEEGLRHRSDQGGPGLR